jgi:hypothetical protein
VNSIVSFVSPDHSLGNVGTPALPVHIQEALSSDQSELNAADKREVNPADPSPVPSVSLISHGVEPDSTTLSTLSQPLPVTVYSGDTDLNPPISDRVQEPVKLSTNVLDPGAASEDTSNRKSTASVIATSILRGVEDSSDAYPPLKSIARHLCVILDNCEVQAISPTFNPQYSPVY